MLCIKNLSLLELGRQGENLARSVQISVQDWYDEFGDSITISLVAQRPTENYGYFPPITVTDGIVNWVITDVDTSFVGTGHGELIATDENGLNVKSKVFKTVIHETITSGASPIVPPPEPSWVDELLSLAQELAEELEEVRKDIAEIQEDIEYINSFVEQIEEIEETLQYAVIGSQSESDVRIIYCGSSTELVTNQ